MTVSDRSGVEQPEGAGRRRIAVWAPRVVILLLVLGAAFLAWSQVAEREAKLDAAREAEAAGRKVALHMVTYDAATLDADFDWVDDDGTKRFAEAFTESAKQVKQLAAATKASSVGTILAAGVHVKDEHSASVVVALDSVLTTPGEVKPSEQRWRLRISLVERDGRWLVNQLDLL